MVDHITERELDYMMARLGLDRTRDAKRHFRALMHAMRIFQERDKVREGVWKEFGASDSAHHCRSKAARLMQHAIKLHVYAEGIDPKVGDDDGVPSQAEIDLDTLEAEALDDGFDLINYAVFFTENVRARRLG